jgi:hypothetical protein
MIHTIRMSVAKWIILKTQLTQDYGANVFLISWKMRKQLGFTVRHHEYWVKINDRNCHREDVCLDFWDPAMQTLFLLKYADIIGQIGDQNRLD